MNKGVYLYSLARSRATAFGGAGSDPWEYQEVHNDGRSEVAILVQVVRIMGKKFSTQKSRYSLKEALVLHIGRPKYAVCVAQSIMRRARSQNPNPL